MAYPTTTQFNPKIIDGDLIGAQGALETSTTQKHPLGAVVRAQDYGTLAYGQMQLIYLKGLASTAAGDVVTYDPVSGVTVRVILATRGPLAVSLSANVANQFGWYAVQGNVPVNTTAAGTGAATAQLAFTATPGQLTVATAIASFVQNAICKTAQDTPSSGFTQVELAWPTPVGGTGVTPT
jgi:hypothetical protein